MYRANKHKAFWPLLIVILSAMFFMGACGGEPETNVEGVIYDFNLYYANSDYVESGDESLGIYIVDARKIEVPKDENPWIVLLEELKKPGSDQLWSAVDEELVFKDVYVDKENPEILYVDLSGIQAGGSLKEGLFIGQIVKTAIANSAIIDENSAVEKVQFLIDGKITESLMGHYESFGPFEMGDI